MSTLRDYVNNKPNYFGNFSYVARLIVLYKGIKTESG